MTTTQTRLTDDRARLIRLIHVGRGQLRLEEEVYRKLLQSATGKTSTTEMRVDQLETVLAWMKKLGFKVRVPKAKGEQRRLAHAPQDRKIRALWLELHTLGAVRDPSEAALNAWIKRETGVEALQWVDDGQAAKLIEKLKQWHFRVLLAGRFECPNCNREPRRLDAVTLKQWLKGQYRCGICGGVIVWLRPENEPAEA